MYLARCPLQQVKRTRILATTNQIYPSNPHGAGQVGRDIPTRARQRTSRFSAQLVVFSVRTTAPNRPATDAPEDLKIGRKWGLGWLEAQPLNTGRPRHP